MIMVKRTPLTEKMVLAYDSMRIDAFYKLPLNAWINESWNIGRPFQTFHSKTQTWCSGSPVIRGPSTTVLKLVGYATSFSVYILKRLCKNKSNECNDLRQDYLKVTFLLHTHLCKYNKKNKNKWCLYNKCRMLQICNEYIYSLITLVWYIVEMHHCIYFRTF